MEVRFLNNLIIIIASIISYIVSSLPDLRIKGYLLKIIILKEKGLYYIKHFLNKYIVLIIE